MIDPFRLYLHGSVGCCGGIYCPYDRPNPSNSPRSFAVTASEPTVFEPSNDEAPYLRSVRSVPPGGPTYDRPHLRSPRCGRDTGGAHAALPWEDEDLEGHMAGLPLRRPRRTSSTGARGGRKRRLDRVPHRRAGAPEDRPDEASRSLTLWFRLLQCGHDGSQPRRTAPPTSEPGRQLHPQGPTVQRAPHEVPRARHPAHLPGGGPH